MGLHIAPFKVTQWLSQCMWFRTSHGPACTGTASNWPALPVNSSPLQTHAAPCAEVSHRHPFCVCVCASDLWFLSVYVLSLFADCVIEGQNTRVANGSSWTDSEDSCVTCTCNVSLQRISSWSRWHLQNESTIHGLQCSGDHCSLLHTSSNDIINLGRAH